MYGGIIRVLIVSKLYMKEILDESSQENVIARSADGLTLEVVNPGEKRELTPEQKAELPQRIKKAEEKYQKEVEVIENRYKESIRKKSKSGMSEAETIIDVKIRTIGLKRAKESYDSKINFLNSLK
jgi:hypothetical protein